MTRPTYSIFHARDEDDERPLVAWRDILVAIALGYALIAAGGFLLYLVIAW